MENNKQTAVEYLEKELEGFCLYRNLTYTQGQELIKTLKQAKEMEEQRHKKFNDFLQKEIELGISDKATIERIEWYYNTYFINNEQQ